MRSIIAGLSIATVTSISWAEATATQRSQQLPTSRLNAIDNEYICRESSNCINTVSRTSFTNLWTQKIANFLLPDLLSANCQKRSPLTLKYNPQESYYRQNNFDRDSNSLSTSQPPPTTASLLPSIGSKCILASRLGQKPFVQTATSNSAYTQPKPTNTESVSALPEFPKLSRSSLIVSLPQDSSFVPKNSQFANPAPETERIASPFGWRNRPYSNQLQFHQGIDYGAPYGSPVVSVGNGIVTRVVSGCVDLGNIFCGGQMGNWIEVDHGNGAIAVYGHLKNSSIAVKEGMKVGKNQNIAQVGSSGWSTGAHLDFRLKINGEYEDPAMYVMSID